MTESIHLGTKIVDMFDLSRRGYAISTDYLPPHQDYDKAAGRFRNLPSMAVVLCRKVPIGSCHAKGTSMEPSESDEAWSCDLRDAMAEFDKSTLGLAKSHIGKQPEFGQPRNLLWWSSLAIIGSREDHAESAVRDENPEVCNGARINDAWAVMAAEPHKLKPLDRVGGPDPRVLTYYVLSKVTVSRVFAPGWRIDTAIELNSLREMVVESRLVRHTKGA